MRDRFYVARYNDATVSFQKGHIILDFSREAESIDAALSTAVKAGRKAGATVDRIEPDPLVSLSDIAARAGMSRAAVTQYSKGQRSKGFPAPIAKVTSDSPLWDWADVAHWLCDHKKVGRETVVEAAALRAANEAIERGDFRIGAIVRKSVRECEAAL